LESNVTDNAVQVRLSVDALEREFDIIAHNMANVSTAGFKRRCSGFLQAVAAQSGGAPGGTGTELSPGALDFAQGTLVQTDRTLDVALYGKGFFVVESPEGPLYTRHGVFQTNRNGQIVDTLGRLVAGTGGPVLVPPDVDISQVYVDDAGRVSAGQASLGQFRLVQFADKETQLLPAGLNCFRAPADAQPKDTESVTVRQGYQEASNVTLVDELVNMIMVSRLYEANMKWVSVNRDNSNSALSVAMG
jgi:flagellar basal-body rod protein FlgF